MLYQHKYLLFVLLFCCLFLFSGCSSDTYIVKKDFGNTTIYSINQTVNVTNNITSFVYNSTKFTQLQDVPNTYVGQNGKCVVVNSLENGLEFKDCANGSFNFSNASGGVITRMSCISNPCDGILIANYIS